MDSFTRGYVEAALADLDWQTGEYHSSASAERISPECMSQIRSDCSSFQRNYGNVIDSASYKKNGNKRHRAGFDFWLTRNRHGAGFWDGDWSEPQAAKLTDAAHRFGEFNLIEGDGEIDCYPPPGSRSNPLDPGTSDLLLIGLGVALLGAIGFAIYQAKQASAAQALAAAYQTQAQQSLAQSLQANPFGQ